MGFNDYTLPNQQEVVATGSIKATLYKFGVTSQAYEIVPVNATRRAVRINNLGDTVAWFGTTPTITTGTTGYNYGYLSAGSNTEIEHYRGSVYVAVGDSVVTYGVSSAGSSIGTC